MSYLLCTTPIIIIEQNIMFLEIVVGMVINPVDTVILSIQFHVFTPSAALADSAM